MVIGLHIGIFFLIAASHAVVPDVAEMPLIVDLLPAPEKAPEPAPAAKALPIIKPQPVKRPRPVKPQPAPQLESTRSDLPAPAAPVVAPALSPAPSAPSAPAASVATETLSKAIYDADYLRNPAPNYPPLSRRMGEEGKVVLRVLVTPSGAAELVEIRTSSGSQRLDEAARKAVRNWKFIPAKRGDSAIQSWVQVPIIFKLEQ